VHFSICVVVRNEEKTLPRLIKSVEHLMKRGLEVNVLDTGSTDATVQIAKSLGCRVLEVGDKFATVLNQEQVEKINYIVEPYDKPLVQVGDKSFHFGDARNAVAEFSTTDFIFQIDADEVFTHLDTNLIEHIISQGYNKCDYAYIYNHYTNGLPRLKQTRDYLYDRRYFKWVGMVHEDIISIPNTKSKLCLIEEPYVLVEHWQNPETNRIGYRVALALTYVLNPTYSRNYHFFGQELLFYGNFLTALKILKEGLVVDSDRHEKSQSLLFMGDCYHMMGNDEKCVEYFVKGFSCDGFRREPLIKLAYHYLKKGEQTTGEEQRRNFLKTVCYASASLEIPWINFYLDDRQQYTYIPHELIYIAKIWLNDIQGAKIHWQKAIEYFPENPKYIADEKYFKEGVTNA
jgi:glycosyltransferase involved in cell wall biosynthesis